MRYRWMYYATGLPGWMRFGYSPGWVGRGPTDEEVLNMPWFGDPWWGAGWPGRGRGFCRFYPWMPRGWWASPYWSYAAPPWEPYAPPWTAPEAELEALKAHAQWLKSELDAISQRIEELEKEA